MRSCEGLRRMCLWPPTSKKILLVMPEEGADLNGGMFIQQQEYSKRKVVTQKDPERK